VIEPVTFDSAGGAVLAGEVSRPATAARAWAVLCHPHPQYGGTMQSIVVSALFGALPDHGIACLRFDFRGAGGSGGSFDGGRGERDDVRAALAVAVEEAGAAPVVLVGWSFGADMALSVREPSAAGWVAIASPLRFSDAIDPTGEDPRPKHFLLAEHDEFQDPSAVRARVAGWRNTHVDVIAGASHFFVGRTDHVIAATRDAIESMLPTEH
jgi:alpha/beta superfamily hydrolase